MKKPLLILFTALNISLFANINIIQGGNSPTSPQELLTGTIIGSPEAEAARRLEMAFDNSNTTWYKSLKANGGWIGLDLGEEHIITSLQYSVHENAERFLTLGVFEGTNSPDFAGAIPIYIIKEQPEINQTTNVDISCSRGFRYVRYVGPENSHCRIAELKFFGQKGIGDDSKLYQATNIPTITIHTKDAVDVTSKDYYLEGTISIISDNGETLHSDNLEIKGRGNASWAYPKKPYRIKLNNKASILGLPANEKSWTLINSYGDKTLIRNTIAFEVSKRFGLAYTSPAVPVDVFLNGEYKGCYQLSDQIEIATNRVSTTKMKATDISLPELSGGYFIEIDAYAELEQSWFASAGYNIPVTIKYPKDDEIVDVQSEYIKQAFERLESAIKLSDSSNQGEDIFKYIDSESLIRHQLINELCGNTDTYWSTYMTKDRNQDQFVVGPVWDFDLAFENDIRTYPINNQEKFIYEEKGSLARGMWYLILKLFANERLQNQRKEIWKEARDNRSINSESLIAYIESLALSINDSQKLNFKRWDIMNQSIQQNPVIWGSYEAEVNNVTNYVKERIAWMDKKLEYLTSNTTAPTKDIFNVFVTNNELNIVTNEPNTKVTIIGSSGKVIYSQTISTNSTTISLPKGIYTVIYTNNDGVNAKKVVI